MEKSLEGKIKAAIIKEVSRKDQNIGPTFLITLLGSEFYPSDIREVLARMVDKGEIIYDSQGNLKVREI